MFAIDITINKELFDKLENKEDWIAVENGMYNISVDIDFLDKLIKKYNLISKSAFRTNHKDYFDILDGEDIVGQYSL